VRYLIVVKIGSLFASVRRVVLHYIFITGNFGSGVGSLFVFTRWVIQMNFFLSLIWFAMVVLPTAIAFDYSSISLELTLWNVFDGEVIQYTVQAYNVVRVLVLYIGPALQGIGPNAVFCEICSVLLCVLEKPIIDNSSTGPFKRRALLTHNFSGNLLIDTQCIDAKQTSQMSLNRSFRIMINSPER
jgi:hypothetical protein